MTSTFPARVTRISVRLRRADPAADGKSDGLAVPEKVFDTFLRAFG